jgi:hypothetical protein
MVLAQLLGVFKTVSSISSAVSGMTGGEATNLGMTGASGIALIIAIYYGKSMYDNLMHRLDRLEDRLAKDINDRHDDLNTKVDTYHETDVRTYERMLITGPPRSVIDLSRSVAQSEESHEEDSSDESHEELENNVKKIKSDVKYIKRKVRHLHHKKD